jgi:CSLREA domain-containing protein
VPSLLNAEGTIQLGSNQGLSKETVLNADVLDYLNEIIVWSGNGTVSVTGPDDQNLASSVHPDGQSFQPTMNGVHEVELALDQFDGTLISPDPIHDWDLRIEDSVGPVDGRVWSLSWNLTSGDFSAENALNSSFFARVPSGSDAVQSVVELRLEGLAGFVFGISANRNGPRPKSSGIHPWQSMRLGPAGSILNANEFRLYLNPPEDATYSSLSPVVGGAAPQGCGFTVQSNVEGAAIVVCDIDNDGLFSLTDPDDLRVFGDAVPGTNDLGFDGRDASLAAIPAGQYDCQAMVATGTFHFVSIDIETVYPGMRFFEVSQEGARSPLEMRWDDSLVQVDGSMTPRTATMPTCGTSPEYSPASGVGASSGLSTVPFSETCPTGTSRAWGDFTGSTKGDDAVMDTYGWIASDQADFEFNYSGDCASMLVDTDQDNTTVNQQCSLREAIINANDGAATHPDCTAGSGGKDTIHFASDYNIVLSSILPAISTPIAIDGGQKSVSLSGNGSNGILIVEDQLEINALTLENGNADVGGAIRNYSTLIVTNSTFLNNQSAFGGAINNEGELTVANSTFVGNSANFGGGVNNFVGTSTIINSTFSENTGIVSGGAVKNSPGDTLHLVNNILANSIASDDCHNDGIIATNMQNLMESHSDCGSPALTGDPLLGATADNGGPTPTLLPMEGSPVIGAGDDTACAADPVNNVDQRGIPRPQDGHCDIGSVERRQDSILEDGFEGN